MIKNKKGVVPLFTAIGIIFIGIIFMGIIISFATQYFDTINDYQRMNNNKNNLIAINDTIANLKGASQGSYKELAIEPTNIIVFDDANETITIDQPINNSDFYTKQKDNQSYGNLEVTKSLNSFTYTMNLNGIADINSSVILFTVKQTIKIEVVDSNTSTPIIEITRVE